MSIGFFRLVIAQIWDVLIQALAVDLPIFLDSIFFLLTLELEFLFDLLADAVNVLQGLLLSALRAFPQILVRSLIAIVSATWLICHA